MVHQERARLTHSYLVQLQRLGADLRWMYCVWYRGRLPQDWHNYRAVEDHLPSYRSTDYLLWSPIFVDHA